MSYYTAIDKICQIFFFWRHRRRPANMCLTCADRSEKRIGAESAQTSVPQGSWGASLKLRDNRRVWFKLLLGVFPILYC